MYLTSLKTLYVCRFYITLLFYCFRAQFSVCVSLVCEFELSIFYDTQRTPSFRSTCKSLTIWFQKIIKATRISIQGHSRQFMVAPNNSFTCNLQNPTYFVYLTCCASSIESSAQEPVFNLSERQCEVHTGCLVRFRSSRSLCFQQLN